MPKTGYNYGNIAKLEKLTAKIFENSGYDIIVENICPNYRIDVIASLSNKKYYIEIKCSTSLQYRNLSYLRDSILKFITLSRENNAVPVLFVYSLLSQKDKEKLRSIYSDLLIFDIRNILYIVNNTELNDELISLLPFSVEQIELQEVALNLSWIKHSDTSSELLLRLDNCIAGKQGFAEFENICFDLLQSTFVDDLSLWHKQEKSNMNLYRFDLLCRIKDYNTKTFWNMMERYFHSKYIIFEFKNYNELITQKEIYTTERYLYNKALRNVAIIIARNGYNDNSVWAAKGCLRENGKLILLLTIDELKKLYELKKDNQDPSEYLLNKLDMLLADLEK